MVDIPTETLSFQWNSAQSSGLAEGNVGDAPQAGWIRLDVTAGQTYNFYAEYVAIDSSAYTELYNSAGDLVASSNFSFVSKLSYVASASDTMFLKVQFLTGSDYNVFVTTQSANDYVMDPLGSETSHYGTTNQRIFGLDGGDHIWIAAGLDAHGGAGNDAIVGNAVANRIIGANGADSLYANAGDDVVWGGRGNDKVWGNDGNDELFGGAGDDVIQAGAGIDRILDIDGLNSLHGGDGADSVTGSGRLYGDAGDDVLIGSAANDTLIGGVGADLLAGGSGADTFVFKIADSTVSSAGQDTVADFNHADGDKIDLRYIDADAGVAGNQVFHFLGSTAFSNDARELRYTTSNGSVYVHGDIDGDGIADLSIRADGITSIAASDFYL